MPTCKVCSAIYDTHTKKRGEEGTVLSCPYSDRHDALIRTKARTKKLVSVSENWSPKSTEKILHRVEKIRDEIHKRRFGKVRRKSTGYQDKAEWGDI